MSDGDSAGEAFSNVQIELVKERLTFVRLFRVLALQCAKFCMENEIVFLVLRSI